MRPSDIATYRLAAQRISGTRFTHPQEVVKHLLAMQAQDYNGALWSIGLRTKNCQISDVEQAVSDRKIVRTWPMRGTLHFMAAEDVRWLLELLAPRVTAVAKGRRLALGLSDSVMVEAEVVVQKALAGGTAMRRDELQKLLTAQVKGVAVAAPQFGHILRNFGERGVICFGPHDGKQPAFVLLDDWLPQQPGKPRAEALAELAYRYFMSHGLATVQDLAGWGYLKMADAKVGLAAVEDRLGSEAIDGKQYYFNPDLKPVNASETFLLPGFDEYMLGYKDRSAALTVEHSNKIVPGGNGMFLPTIVQGGQVIGTWKRVVRKDRISITPSLFKPSPKLTKQAIQPAIQQYGSFLNRSAELSL